ncbi:MAG: cation-transporting P-type ATPase, partial [Bacteroidota bacterium]
MQEKNYAWHAHAWKETLSVLDTTEEGLSEAVVEKRRETYGRNAFTPAKEVGAFVRILVQLKSPLTFVLVLAFVLTAVLQEYVDAGVIFFALSIAVGVGVLQEGKASRAFKKLADSQVRRAVVLRDGAKHEVDTSELVPGDIVELNNGSQVPADVRLIFTKKLSVNEASLTGEWLAVDKHIDVLPAGAAFAEQKNMAWMGTFVAEGYGQGVVVATGDQTAIGQVADNLRTIEDEDTPLQIEMRRISMLMLYIFSALVVCIFVIGIWQGQSLHDMLLTSIAVAVASVPEGLPAAVTIILAVGMEALLHRGGLVR